MTLRALVLLFCVAFVLPAFAGDSTSAPDDPATSLFFTPQRMRRLKRDRERQTERWTNFETRVKQAPDSSERGIELAVYYAVTGDDARAREAADWASAHPCESRQLAVLRQAGVQIAVRDPSCTRQTPSLFAYFGIDDAAPRDAFLLSLHPEQVEHPSWRQHAAALALVNLDPNSNYAQFLQGWAMEPRFTLRDGPGVVYEFLWADPYLPGVSYQNMQPWSYHNGVLFARSDWSERACWIKLSEGGAEQQNCPANWKEQGAVFGDLLFLPLEQRCFELKRDDPRQVIILRGLKPGATINYTQGDSKTKAEADGAGMWRVPELAGGKVCVAR